MPMKDICLRIKRKAGSIRMHTLIYFIIGILITMVVAYGFGYQYMYTSVDRINTNSMQSEISQINIGLNSLYDSMGRLNTQTIENEYFQKLLAHNSSIDADLIYSVNGFRSYARDFLSHYVYLHSMYLFLPDGRTYCFSMSNVRFLFDESDLHPSKDVQTRILTYTGKEIAYMGGFSANDFPVQGAESEDIGLVSMVCFVKNARLVFNLYASELESSYSAIASDDNRMIYVLSEDGMVVSSLDSEKVGRPYEYTSLVGASGTGDLRVDNCQIFFGKQANSKLVTVIELYSSDFMSKFNIQERIMFLIIILGLVCTCFLFNLWMKKALSPMDRFIRSMELAGQGVYSHDLPEDGDGEISVLARHYNKMLRDLQIMTRNKERAEQEKIECELAALRSQINPHFLYNTLNNIKWMALIGGNDKVASSITALAKYIAPMFQENGATCTLRDELYTVDLYSQIMNARFEGGVTLRENIDPQAEQARVPRFILQPIIENCFTHGLSKSNNEGIITIWARKTDTGIEIRVEDNGIGIKDDELRRINEVLESGALTKEIGLTNTNRRLRLSYGASYGIRLEHSKSGPGMAVICVIPDLI